jgi:hypothetical protein
VLGYLRQEPSWCKVLDTASGKIYYWNLSSNEVVWQVPEGMDADALLPPDSAGAGADAAAADGEAGATPPAMDAVAPAADITAAAEAADDDQQRDSSPDELHPALAPQQAAPGRKSATPASASSDEEEGQIKADVAADLAKQLLQPPNHDIASVFSVVTAELDAAAGQLLGSLPPLLQLAVETRVRLADWQQLSAQQQAAVQAGDASKAHSWRSYEMQVMTKLRDLFDGFQQHGEQQQQQQPSSTAAAGEAGMAARSRSSR